MTYATRSSLGRVGSKDAWTLAHFHFHATPLCTEGITWYVLKTPIEMSAAQIDAYTRLEHLGHTNRLPHVEWKSLRAATPLL